MKKTILICLIIFLNLGVFAQEKIFAGYFDVEVNSPANTEVTGRIHLERNKDVLKRPVPKTYQFAITSQKNNLFSIETRFDPVGRIMGVLSTKQKLGENLLGNQQLTIVLKDGSKQLNSFPITIKVVKETLWKTLYERYKDYTVSSEGSRMYGRKLISDVKVAEMITELESNNGKFAAFGFYGKNPMEYKSPGGKTIEFEWEQVANQIGGLGYAYAKSKKYGPNGDPQARMQLKNALYSAIIAYTESVPVEGSDVMVKGKPIGPYTGDGFSNLKEYNLVGTQVVTHQWVISDALIAPSVHLIPDMLTDIKQGNKQAERVYYDFIRFYQTAMAEMIGRRSIDKSDDKEEGGRWGILQDTLRSSGAWADANLGHRGRWMLAMPIVWADYNRPLTYVQYWYSDFYKDKPFKNFSFSYGWSPHGVAADVSRWLTKFNVPAHEYKQSGFQPDGTISHHIAQGTDAAMQAYGFGWLVEAFVGFNQFKDTDFKLADKYYQFPADRLVGTYPKLIYKNRLDFLVSGRSYGEDLQKFVTKVYLSAFEDLQEARSKDTKLSNQAELDEIYNKIKKNKFEYSGTDAFWVNEFLVHRRGENEKPFYVSLKLKSKRTVGAEDFGNIRRSWYAGYGILPLKISGDEYSDKVLANLDWHALPGLTEEWRSDAIPVGHAQASLPGDNEVAGVTSDGRSGVAIYHHLPRETYSSATALKSYFFIADKIIALGNNIKRLRPGQQKEIVTTLDQSAFTQPLTIAQNGKTEVVQPGQSVNLSFEADKPVWLHIGNKGYIIYPDGKQKIIVKTGTEINITDPANASKTPGYIIAVNHGQEPATGNGYSYFLVPNVLATEMPAVLATYAKDVQIKKAIDAHGVYSATDKTWQTAFFKGTAITVGGLTVKAETPALMILKDNGSNWKLTMSNPSPSADKQQLVLYVSQPLRAGKYDYMLGGIYPRKGEYVTVSAEGTGSKIVAELPDKRDSAFYNYQEVLYNAAPVSIEIPKK
ncbi:polysaccharide lyase family 8 super-sandwich domain-containing protein [Pedobacter heparinus]|uniref:Polysaccharide lyase family 8 n=1 Tax=Pedobacter heparinus (strain ATCC 13125 / DSM 2366 / CIP 104194 / JCM 7457 / NBRC 12017 / NCIMB 9290 / NRRL B-14731 / HIM 762-3) TaxID=485917 RepID=C6Y1P7_PEDHD|nr:polysaccharide lyase family 8 super-sandwich domain-containing protein [Pedobacter heparinus]ACU05039.1 polysaccharide lyase family 8 [Pedobacter heparinus DSM 2366]